MRSASVWLLLFSIPAGVAWAASSDKPPKGIPVAGFRAHPFIRLITRWEDNIYKTEYDPKSDRIMLVKPGLKLEKQNKRLHLTAVSELEAEYYAQHKREDNKGYSIKLDADYKLGKRWKTQAGVEESLLHDERGSPGVGPSVTSLGPNAWRQRIGKLGAEYQFHRIKVETDLQHGQKISLNNNQSSQNNVWDEAVLKGKWAFLPKTGVVLESGWRVTRYELQPIQDNVEKRLLGGVTWKLSSRTSGTIKAGPIVKIYDNSSVPKATGITWSSETEWRLKERTRVTTGANRNFQAGLTGSFIQTAYKLNVDHKLLQRLSAKTGLALENSDYGQNKTEDYVRANLGLKYLFPRWLSLETDYQRSTKKTATPGQSYVSNALMFTLSGDM
ncbi:MAG: outer membrane beta-barrel protein [Magnetococcales bacterium]|nr:outer membrane beta-barrel protein [Magnetococcales bacterium]